MATINFEKNTSGSVRNGYNFHRRKVSLRVSYNHLYECVKPYIVKLNYHT